MTTPAAKPSGEIKLELPADDPRFTPLVRRLATEYWEVVQRNAERVGFPIVRAWVEVDVDMDEETWFPFTVHSPVTHEEAWAFRDELGPDLDRWVAQLAPEARELIWLVSLAVVGLKRRQRARNGA